MNDHIEEIDSNTKRDKGFTLVELLIVIVILGILATVTVFAVRGITDKGTTSACQADLKTLEVGIEAWYALPATVTVDGAVVNKEIGTANGEPSEAELVQVKLIRALSTKYDVGAKGVVTVQDTTCPAPT